MTLALRRQAVVDQNHAVHLQSDELVPGAKVEVIVLVENPDTRAARESIASFLVGAQRLAIEAAPDFSVDFEESLYGADR